MLEAMKQDTIFTDIAMSDMRALLHSYAHVPTHAANLPQEANTQSNDIGVDDDFRSVTLASSIFHSRWVTMNIFSTTTQTSPIWYPLFLARFTPSGPLFAGRFAPKVCLPATTHPVLTSKCSTSAGCVQASHALEIGQ